MTLSPATQGAIDFFDRQIADRNAAQPRTPEGLIERTRTVQELQRCLREVKKGIEVEKTT